MTSVDDPVRSRPTSRSTAAAARAALPLAAVIVFGSLVGLTIAAAGETLGYDYQAYVGAAERLLAGQPLYDPNVDVAGGFAIYLYPPPFAIAFIPFALLPDSVGLWLWIGACAAMVPLAIAAMPVGATTRWVVLLLAGLSWPVVYSIKLGQVGPLLLLLFAVGWRCLDRPVPLGTTMVVGALVKIQPGLLFLWAALTGRWRAVAVGLVIGALACLVSVVVVGIDAWLDYVALLRRVSDPISTPNNVTLGAVAYQRGLDPSIAAVLQAAAIVGTIVVTAWAILRRSDEVGYLVTIVASQLLSPVLWDHYAMILLLPTAYLLDRGRWWAALIPLATTVLLVGVTPSFVYPIVFAVALLAPVLTTSPRQPERPATAS